MVALARRPAGTVTLTRSVNAPALQAYAAWTDPDLLGRWFAPAPYTAERVEADARIGGRWRVDVIDGAGGRHSTAGEYRELVPGRRIVKTCRHQGPGQAVSGPQTLVTVTFDETGPGSTEVTITHEPAVDPAEALRAGWEDCLDKLAALLG